MRLTAIVATGLTYGAISHGLASLEAQGSGPSADQKQILSLEQAIGQAIADGDAASYDRLTTADFQFITGAGVMMTKAERLALLKNGPSPGFRTSDHAIRMYGNVAVVTGRQGPGAGAVRFTRVWVRQGNEWRAVVTQATGIQQPKP
jgi:Domain of unknown function (DUF4440)